MSITIQTVEPTVYFEREGTGLRQLVYTEYEIRVCRCSQESCNVQSHTI